VGAGDGKKLGAGLGPGVGTSEGAGVATLVGAELGNGTTENASRATSPLLPLPRVAVNRKYVGAPATATEAPSHAALDATCCCPDLLQRSV
jgi:hypothetical protein